MSRSTIVPRKSSPCCIGCIVLLVILVGFSVAIGIYMYRFAKDNISLVEVAGKSDPSLETEPEVLLPETVGEFRRTSLANSLENVPGKYWGDLETSGVQVAVYEDQQNSNVTVIAMSTDEARDQRDMGMGPLMTGRGKANSTDTGISIRDPFSGDVPNTIITWQKPNWTFMVQTTSTKGLDFVEAFNPGDDADVTVQSGQGQTTVTLEGAAEEPAISTPEVTPVPTATPTPTVTPAPAETPESTPATPTPTEPEPTAETIDAAETTGTL